MTFVDASVWIDLFADRASRQVGNLTRRLLRGEQVGLTAVALTALPRS